MTPILGTVLCIGVTIFCFGSMLVPILSACNGNIFECGLSEPRLKHGGTWEVCPNACPHEHAGGTSQPNCYFIRQYISSEPGIVTTADVKICEIIKETARASEP